MQLDAHKPYKLRPRPNRRTYVTVGKWTGICITVAIMFLIAIWAGIIAFFLSMLIFPVIGEIIDLLVVGASWIVVSLGAIFGSFLGLLVWKIVDENWKRNNEKPFKDEIVIEEKEPDRISQVK